MTTTRLRRNTRIRGHSVEEGVWGLYNLDTGRMLFTDELTYRILEQCEHFSSIDALQAACEQQLADTSSKIPLNVPKRIQELVDFDCFDTEPERRALNVLLVEPPCAPKMMGSKGPGKALPYLSQALQNDGLPPAQILDMRSVSDIVGRSRVAQANYFLRYAESCAPDVIGVTAVSATIEQALFIVRLSRAVFPEARIVMGGPHVSYEWETLLAQEPAIDFIVRGEGELPFPVLIRRLQAAGDARISLDDIPGFAWREASGESVTSGWCHGLEDLDSIGFPDDRRGLVNLDDYEIEYPRVIANRGCPFKCSFCSTATFTGRRIRWRNIEKVLDEIGFYWEKYGARQLTIDDDIFTAKKKYTYEFCEAFRRRPFASEVEWGCNTRIDCIDEPLLDAMYEAGCRWIFFGIESGDETVQKRFGKGGRVLEGFRDKLAYMQKIGLDPHLNFILGLPGENPETIAKVKDLIRGFPTVPCGFNFLNVFPGTPLSLRASDLGIEFIGDRAQDRYSMTAPTISTATMSEQQQIGAFLELEWQRKREYDDAGLTTRAAVA